MISIRTRNLRSLKNSGGVLPLGGAGMAARKKNRKNTQKQMTLAVVGPNANRTLTLTANYGMCFLY
jgi:hypothetical protein